MKYQFTVLLFVLFSLVLFTGRLNAQVPLNLKTALKYTLDHHTQVQHSLVDVQMGKEILRESISTGLPQINANATILNNLALRTSLIPAEFLGGQPGEFAQLKFGTNWNANAGVQLNQMLFNKQWLLALEGTKKLNDFYNISLEKSKEEVVYETAKLYYQILLANTQKGILEANFDQVKGLLVVTDMQFQNGFAKKIDVDRLRVQQSNLIIQLDNLELQVVQLEQALKFAMQMPLETDIVLTDTINTTINAIDPTTLPSTYGARPSLTLLDVQKDLYDLDFRRWRAGYFPTVNLFGSYTYEWQADNIGDFTKGMRWTDYSQIGLHFNFPIFDGFYNKSQMQMAELNKIKVGQNYQYTLMAYQLQHQSALTSLLLNRNNLKAVTETRQVAEEVYAVTQKRYKEGIAPITELLDAEASMREAQTNFVTTLAQIKLSEIDLMHANGKLLQIVDQ